MTTGTQLYQRLVEDADETIPSLPDCKLLASRLVYADWLEEQGDHRHFLLRQRTGQWLDGAEYRVYDVFAREWVAMRPELPEQTSPGQWPG